MRGTFTLRGGSCLRMRGRGFSVLPDRAVGGGVLQEGLATLMLHRRLTLDDQLGVGEVLSEPGLDSLGTGLVIKTLHRVLVHGDAVSGAVARRGELSRVQRPPILLFKPNVTTPASYAAAHVTQWSALAAGALGALENVELVTLQAWGPDTLLLRLAHSFEAGEGGAGYGEDAVLSLAGLFNASTSGITLTSCSERTVTGSEALNATQQVTYRVLGGEAVTLPTVPPPPTGASGLGNLTLSPLAIRTFLCTAALAGGPPIVL